MKKLILRDMLMSPTPNRVFCEHCGGSRINGYDFKVTLNFTSSGNFENLSQEEISRKIYALNKEITIEL